MARTRVVVDPITRIEGHLRIEVEIEGGVVKDVRIALGGVAHKPWRASKAEAVLRGGPATEQAFRAAAVAEMADAQPLRDNGFKIELTKRTLVAVLGDLAGAAA